MISQTKSDDQDPVVTIGVIADTHIPDRLPKLHPGILDLLQSYSVSQILHAGDICTPRVLDELGQIAPVMAVKGNRDFIFNDNLPLVQHFHVNGWQIALMHGSGTHREYWFDKWQYVLHGYRIERYKTLVMRTAPAAQIIVFGHTHRPLNEWVNGKLLFNPGSASFGPPEGGSPTLGLLRFHSDGTVGGEVLPIIA
jgi:putative phosphoesterase